jgi:hypothetical protein
VTTTVLPVNRPRGVGYGGTGEVDVMLRPSG